MRVIYQSRPKSFEEACRVLEAMAEGAVRAMVNETSRDPKALPCCIGCGEFVVRNAPMFPAQPAGIEHMIAERGYGFEPDDVLETLHGIMPSTDAPDAIDALVKIGCARDIAMNKGGSTLELACYQAAQRRRRGDDPECIVIVTGGVDCDGFDDATFRAAVWNSKLHYMPDKAGRLDCPVQRLGPGECACGVEGR